ncbi:MAG: hypothetical protein M0D55_12245 [Elusimicrobiota bacterium]|nr:MAG: hypothetical protein M0D55_12245 [Elusimicrobiota bacterium]
MDENEKLAKEAMKSLFTPAPADLKASLKRMARAKSAKPSLWDGLLESLSGGAWAYGAGAAFAAAAVAVVLVKAVPERRETPVTVAPAQAPAPQALAELWSDDDGGDHD